MEARDLAVGLAGGRVCIGGAVLFGAGGVGGAVVGARDLALGIGVLATLDRNGPVRGWLRASAVVDGLDAAGSLLGRRHLRPTVFPAAAAAASSGALLSGWLAGRLD